MSDSPTSQHDMSLPAFTGTTVFSVKAHNKAVKRINALIQMQSKAAKSNGPLLLGEDNCILPVAGSPDGSGGAGLTRFQITALGNNDYVTCAKWTNGAFTGSFNIAKDELLRPSLVSEVIDGLTVTYSARTDNQRTANNGTDTYTQKMVPRYRVNDIIYASGVVDNATGVTDAGTWLEVKPARHWDTFGDCLYA